MSQAPARHEITRKKVLYEMPGTESVAIRRDVEYRATDAGALTMDIYYPPGATPGSQIPAVVFVIGFSDIGARAMLGCAFKEMDSFTSWARLTAASGLVAVTYSTGTQPAEDIRALLQYLRQNAKSLRIDATSVALWACSGHGPNALSVLTQENREQLTCAALCYPYTLDLEGNTGIADAAAMFRFVNSAAGKSVDDLPQDLPLFIARAGQDMTPHLNAALDRFLAKALGRNLPVTIVNHAAAPHAFDVANDSGTSREIIRQLLAFFRFQPVLANGLLIHVFGIGIPTALFAAGSLRSRAGTV